MSHVISNISWNIISNSVLFRVQGLGSLTSVSARVQCSLVFCVLSKRALKGTTDIISNIISNRISNSVLFSQRRVCACIVISQREKRQYFKHYFKYQSEYYCKQNFLFSQREKRYYVTCYFKYQLEFYFKSCFVLSKRFQRENIILGQTPLCVTHTHTCV